MRNFSLLAVVLIVALLLGACGGSDSPSKDQQNQAKPPVFGVSLMNVSSEFITMIDQAVEAKAKELGIKLVVNDAQRSPEKQVQQIESTLARVKMPTIEK